MRGRVGFWAIAAIGLLAACTSDDAAAFSPEDIERRWTQGDQADAYVVVSSSDVDLEAAASACVQTLRSEEGIEEAYCWVFADAEALAASEPSQDSPGMKHLCWSARAGAGVGDEEPLSAINDSFDQPCPGAEPLPSSDGGDASGFGAATESVVEGFPIPGNATETYFREYDEDFGGGMAAQYEFSDSTGFADLVAWYDQHAPEGQPWRDWQYCQTEGTDRGSIMRVWVNEASGLELILSMYADTPGIGVATENRVRC